MSHWSGKSGSAESTAGTFGRSPSGGPSASVSSGETGVANPAVAEAFSIRPSFSSVSRNEALLDDAMTTPIFGQRWTTLPPAFSMAAGAFAGSACCL